MHVHVQRLVDFFTHIDASRLVYEKKVYWDIADIEQGEYSKEIVCRASTVLITASEIEQMIEYTHSCGMDRLTADGDKSGTELAESLASQLQRECQKRDLTIMPGILRT